MPARGGEPPPAAATPSGSTRAGRVPWAELLRRVIGPDTAAYHVLGCVAAVLTALGFKSLTQAALSAPKSAP